MTKLNFQEHSITKAFHEAWVFPAPPTAGEGSGRKRVPVCLFLEPQQLSPWCSRERKIESLPCSWLHSKPRWSPQWGNRWRGQSEKRRVGHCGQSGHAGLPGMPQVNQEADLLVRSKKMCPSTGLSVLLVSIKSPHFFFLGGGLGGLYSESFGGGWKI